MKAIHTQTNREYEVHEVIGETVVLKNNKGVKRRISYELFKSQFQLSEGHLDPFTSRKNEAQEIAEEVLKECEALVEPEPEPRTPKKKAKKKTKKKVKGDPTSQKKGKPKKKTKPRKKGEVESKREEVQSTTLKEICDELGITPAAARRILRKEKVGKPGGSWSWTCTQEIEKIRSLLK